MRRIAYADEGAAAIGAAMQLVALSSALILDLRACSGGTPEGAAMWCSYFFHDDQVHLNDFYERSTGATRQFWTTAHLPAPRYADRPVHVLTSAVTFSGGEDVAYTLQAHGRAVVVGETTRGGAHPTARHPVTEHILVTGADRPDYQQRHRHQLGGRRSGPRRTRPSGPGTRHGTHCHLGRLGAAARRPSLGRRRQQPD
ncbi:S41 family peptidase [Micromonospora saelicesensis]|uniref:S41 family peptidase n=1 Tax=Micromonospora saelicesensis TaxID=285676 RepID=UPI003CEF3D93